MFEERHYPIEFVDRDTFERVSHLWGYETQLYLLTSAIALEVNKVERNEDASKLIIIVKYKGLPAIASYSPTQTGMLVERAAFLKAQVSQLIRKAFENSFLSIEALSGTSLSHWEDRNSLSAGEKILAKTVALDFVSSDCFDIKWLDLVCEGVEKRFLKVGLLQWATVTLQFPELEYPTFCKLTKEIEEIARMLSKLELQSMFLSKISKSLNPSNTSLRANIGWGKLMVVIGFKLGSKYGKDEIAYVQYALGLPELKACLESPTDVVSRVVKACQGQLFMHLLGGASYG